MGVRAVPEGGYVAFGYSASNCALAASIAASFSGVSGWGVSAMPSMRRTITPATSARATCLSSAGMTNQGAHFVDVAARTSSYAAW